MKNARRFIGLIMGALACSGSDGEDGANALTAVDDETSGSDCSTGGLRVRVGLDSDGNGELDDSEVTSTSYVCNGTDGADGSDGSAATGVLGIASTPVSSGSTCAAGGVSLQPYRDSNQNGALDAGEELGTATTLCNGLDGNSGSSVARLRITAEPAGSNCSAGGTALQPWEDSNSNGMFDSGEENGTPSYVCNGNPSVANGSTPIVNVYRSANVAGTRVTQGDSGSGKVLSATITTPGPGSILALASSLAYCDSTGPDVCAPSGTLGFLTVVQDGVGGNLGNSGQFVSALVQPSVDNEMSARAQFDLPAGTYTFSAVAKAEPAVVGETAQLLFGASNLTLIFIPH